MKTLSPQILAFYLGCEVELNSPREKIVTGFIQEIDVTGNCIVASMEITRRSNIRRIKPLLRKLSSMTFDEAEQCAILTGKKKVYSGDYWHNNKSFMNITQKQAFGVTAYLLSKHFDLFNLIENNLAIDKDTLK